MICTEQVYVRKETSGLWMVTQNTVEEWSCVDGSSGLAFVTVDGPIVKQQWLVDNLDSQ